MFRLKIALLSALLSGAVLVSLGMYSLDLMNKVALARIDQEILSLGEGHLAVGPPRGYWQNFEKSFGFIYGEGRRENLIVQIKDPGNEVLYKSVHWPTELSESFFPDFDRTREHRPPDLREGAGDGLKVDPRPVEHDAAPDRTPPVRSGDSGSARRGPPPEAYKACEGKSAGSLAQFIDSRGETLKGTCEDENGRLVLRPDRSKSQRQESAQDVPGARPFPAQAGNEQANRPLPRIKKSYFATIQTSSGTWRTGIMGSERITMMVGVNLAGYYEDAARYRKAFLGLVPIALLLLAAGGWIIAQRALKPVSLITRTAEGITARALDQRVPPVATDRELSRLVEVINSMLDRLEKSFSQAVRFSADAAHELQTPLTILQGELDAAVQHAAVGSGEQRRASGLRVGIAAARQRPSGRGAAAEGYRPEAPDPCAR